MRALASLGLYEESAARTFSLMPAGAALRDGPVRKMALWIAGEFNLKVYANAMHSVKTGEPAVAATVGTEVFEYFATQPELSKIFNDAMTGFSAAVIPAVLEAYDFSGIGTLVDVAGGHGGILTAIHRAGIPGSVRSRRLHADAPRADGLAAERRRSEAEIGRPHCTVQRAGRALRVSWRRPQLPARFRSVQGAMVRRKTFGAAAESDRARRPTGWRHQFTNRLEHDRELTIVLPLERIELSD